MKQKGVLLYIGIVLVVGIGVIIFIIHNNKTEKEENTDSEDMKIVESELEVTTQNLEQLSYFLGGGSEMQGALTFNLWFENTAYEIVIWDKYASLRVKGNKVTVWVDRLYYAEGVKANIEWVPNHGMSVGSIEEEYEEAREEERISLNMDHYVYVILKQQGCITGLMVLKFPVEENNTFLEMEPLAFIQFEKQNGEYQKVTRKYIEKRVEQIIKADSE